MKLKSPATALAVLSARERLVNDTLVLFDCLLCKSIHLPPPRHELRQMFSSMFAFDDKNSFLGFLDDKLTAFGVSHASADMFINEINYYMKRYFSWPFSAFQTYGVAAADIFENDALSFADVFDKAANA